MKKTISVIIIFITLICFSGCKKTNTDPQENTKFSVGMITDVNGINDNSFNASAWKGLTEFSKETGLKTKYIESHQRSDFFANFDILADKNFKLIFGLGFTMSDAIETAAQINPEINYAIVDFSYGDKTPDNVTGVVFSDQETSFLAGIVAAYSTETNSVGFIGGMKGIVIDKFEKGFRAGVAYGAKELGKKIETKWQYAESFSDSAKVKGIAMKMYSSGTDIIYHAAGQSGGGLIEAAKETNNFAIGVDEDQLYLAPKNILTSALKNVGKAVKLISYELLNGEKIGGQTRAYGLKEECVGLPENNPNLDTRVYNIAMKIKEEIISGKIIPPYDEKTYKEFEIKYNIN